MGAVERGSRAGGALLAGLVAAPAWAAPAAPLRPGERAVDLVTGVDASVWTGELGLRGGVLGGRGLELGAAVALPLFVGPADHRLAAELRAPLALPGRATAALTARPLTWTRAANDVHRLASLGSGAGLQLGRAGDVWTGVVTVDVDWAWTTHIRHEDLYRERVYAEVQDGWYRATGATLRAGVAHTWRAGPVDLHLDLAAVRTLALERWLFVPGVQATVGVSRRWGYSR